MTRRILDLHARYQLAGDANGKYATLRDLSAAAVTREQYLASIIDEHPAEVIRAAVSARARAALPRDVQRHVEEEVTTEGQIEVLHEDGPDGSRYHYFLDRPEGRMALHFAADAPVLQTGDTVRAAGVRVQQALALGSGTTALSVQAAALPNTFGAQKTAVILVNFQDKPTDAWVTPTQVYTTVFSTDSARSVTNYYLEASYGQTWLEGDVYGVYTIPMSSTGSCNYGSIASYAKQAATSQVGATKMSTYRRFVFAFPRIGCGWGGLGTVGGNPSQAWINGTPSAGVVSHEMGHNFGLWHSHALYCDDGQSACSTGTSIEYGDRFDVMGDGTSGPMHFNAPQKELLGWLNYGDSPPIRAVQSSGTYTIDPYEPDGTNPKALKVKTPSGDWYYIEYRQALGFDSDLLYNTNVTNGALVHRWSGNQNPDRIHLLNMRPAANDWTHPALEVGSSFSDGGITITPVWAEDTLGVAVSLGGGGSTCVRNAPTVKVTPAQQQGKPGTAVSYTVSVTNNDSGCTMGSFKQQATVPNGWAANFTASTLGIASGATASTSLTVTSSAAAAAGVYSVSPKASNVEAPANTASATATYDVRAAGGASGTFIDNFNRTDSTTLGNGWALVAGSLMIQGNRATSAPGKAMNTSTQPSLVGPEQAIVASFVSGGKNSAPEFGLLARYNDAGNYYTCYRRTGASSVLRIAKVVGGVETILGSVGVANPAKGASFKLGCEAQGTSITVTLNGAKKLTRTDATFSSGSVGLSLGYRAATNTIAVPLWIDDFTASVH